MHPETDSHKNHSALVPPFPLASAPHRPLFLAGCIAVLTGMTWWTMELGTFYHAWPSWPQPTIPPLWGHAVLMQYGLFPLFMFGFLMTTFPRWMTGPQVPRWRYLGVGGCVLGGYVVSHVGLLHLPMLLRAGMVLMLLGYLLGVGTLAGVLKAATERNRHGWSCLTAFTIGTLGLMLFEGWLFGLLPASAAQLSVQIGTFGFLLPMYFTVCHRMLPFFSRHCSPNYRMWRPAFSLPLMWMLLLVRTVLAWREAQAALAWVDIPLALLFLVHALAWQPWRARGPGLLVVLHLAFAWLPVAFVLFSAQDLVYALQGRYILGLAPLHALTIGFFGSMLVAMVTRVTQGHSGRPLQMNAVAWTCFGVLQLVALARIRAELGDSRGLWLLAASVGWLVAFMPWVIRGAFIYLTPRADGRPG
ncbi:NnrS family protein [Oleiagrimonas sp. MCCC 1A03011]|uniref:NnrS family protein n=1 Tax=Oleiagrimonas sp. MCCC 1A03011 TaxID=1926883 RepID=UPI000DC441C8|nr:NnrS family protein [Oleiagrimonas sp. MCCC 1A03011]RAP55694.1 short-chain dehydrogenase [Oleiagrimonas sp. MCCC 1A03011]